MTEEPDDRPPEIPGGTPRPSRGAGAIVYLNPWPTPDFEALGLTAPARRFRGPSGQWQQTSPPGTSPWEEAFEGVELGMATLAGVSGPIDVFASTAAPIGLHLALHLTRRPGGARFWQTDGRAWHCHGVAQRHGKAIARAAGPRRLLDGPPIGLLIEVGTPIESDELPFDFAELQTIRFSAPGAQRLPELAQQIAHDLLGCLGQIEARAPWSTVHLVFAGPLSAIMMAAPAIARLRNVIVYERTDRPARYRPALHCQLGRSDLVRSS